MSTGEQYWDAVQKCQGLLAPLVHQSAHYLEILPKIRRWVHRRDWAEHKLGSPRLAKRARLVFDHRSEQIRQFYTEFGAFTRDVRAALNRLRDVLPHHEVDALTGQVDPYNIESTCRAVQRAAERIEQFCGTRPAIQQPGADREHRLQQFRKDQKATIAAVRTAADVHKPEMQKWRHSELGDESVMSQRIEEVLSGSRPLQPRRSSRKRHQTT